MEKSPRFEPKGNAKQIIQAELNAEGLSDPNNYREAIDLEEGSSVEQVETIGISDDGIELEIDEESSLDREETQENEFFSEVDKQVLRNGMHVLKNYFEKLPVEKLPSVISFLDSAARPFFYFLKPLFDQVYKTKGIKPPECHFTVNFSKNADIKVDDAFEAEQNLIERLQEVNRDLERGSSDQTYLLQDKKDFEDELVRVQQELKEAKELQRLFETDEEWMRVKRMRSLYERAPNGQVMFVDDFISEGGTLRNLEETIQELVQAEIFQEMKPVVFSFYRTILSKKFEKELPDANLHVISGSFGDNYSGFRYRNGFSFNPEKVKRYQREKEARIGVQKVVGKEYAIRPAHASNRELSAFRTFLDKFGKEVLEEENKQTNRKGSGLES